MPRYRRGKTRVVEESAWVPTFVGMTVLQLAEVISRSGGRQPEWRGTNCTKFHGELLRQ